MNEMKKLFTSSKHEKNVKNSSNQVHCCEFRSCVKFTAGCDLCLIQKCEKEINEAEVNCKNMSESRLKCGRLEMLHNPQLQREQATFLPFLFFFALDENKLLS
jgi:hypothetical protein